jgi:hypothetical protein
MGNRGLVMGIIYLQGSVFKLETMRSKEMYLVVGLGLFAIVVEKTHNEKITAITWELCGDGDSGERGF